MAIPSETNCARVAPGTPPLTIQAALDALQAVPGWELHDHGRRIERKLKFPDFDTARHCADRIADLAAQQDHHPDLHFGWGYCTILLHTHKVKGLHANDFILASKINAILKEPEFAQDLQA